MNKPLGYFGFESKKEYELTEMQARKLIVLICKRTETKAAKAVKAVKAVKGAKIVKIRKELLVEMFESPRAAIEWATQFISPNNVSEISWWGNRKN